jgi:hypothetical protein
VEEQLNGNELASCAQNAGSEALKLECWSSSLNLLGFN